MWFIENNENNEESGVLYWMIIGFLSVLFTSWARIWRIFQTTPGNKIINPRKVFRTILSAAVLLSAPSVIFAQPVTSDYEYDEHGRLKKATYDSEFQLGFEYDLQDNRTQLSVVSLMPPNQPPIPRPPFTKTVIQQGSVDLLVLNGASDPDVGDSLSVAGVSNVDAAAGNAANVTGDKIVFTAGCTVASDPINYTITDNNYTVDGSVTVNVQASSNTVPTPTGQAYIYPDGWWALPIAAIHVASDPDAGQVMTFISVSGALSGTAEIINNNPLPHIRYIPNAVITESSELLNFTLTDGNCGTMSGSVLIYLPSPTGLFFSLNSNDPSQKSGPQSGSKTSGKRKREVPPYLKVFEAQYGPEAAERRKKNRGKKPGGDK